MKLPRPSLLFLSFALGLLALSACAIATHNGFKDIFNGKDLTGWDGNKEFWTVRDGAITGQTTAEKVLKANTFLVYQAAQPANFELRASFRLVPNNPNNQANSGIQYRSKVIDPATFVVGGYQADIDSTGRYAGMLYEEKGRGLLMTPGEKIRLGTTAVNPETKKKKTAVEKLGAPSSAAEILAVYKLGQWNELRIVAQGNHVQHFLNGKLTADVTDDDPTLAAQSGVLALQLHQGPPMTVQFKDLRLKTLP